MSDPAVAWAGALQAAATIRARYEAPGHYKPEETAEFIADLAHRLLMKANNRDPEMRAMRKVPESRERGYTE